jgi:hypothetical protein
LNVYLRTVVGPDTDGACAALVRGAPDMLIVVGDCTVIGVDG